MGTFGRFLKSAGLFLDKHRPEILTGVGIGGMIGTVVLAVRGTPKAVLLLEERKKEENVEKLTPLQTIETAWKCYIPSALMIGWISRLRDLTEISGERKIRCMVRMPKT